LIAAVEALTEAAYTTGSWEVLEQALESATAVAENIDAVDSELSAAVSALTAVPPRTVEIVPPVDKAIASNAVAKASALAQSSYTAQSWGVLQAALAAARPVLADSGATQAQVDQALSGVVNALAALQPVLSVGDGPDVPVLAVSKVKLGQSQLTLVRKKSLTVPAGVYFSDARSSYKGALVWKSSNSKVAKVDQNGKVTAVKKGTATITATTKAVDVKGKKVSAKLKVKVVTKKPKAKVTKVSASVPKSMRVGQVVYVTGKYSSAKATGVQVKYSSKYQRAVVDKAGRIVGKSKGKDTITVKAGGKTKRYAVTVR
jgi:hypothetical protein